jgi:chromosome partitioning protein
MAKVICFANMKGGVGKTTLCVNLAFSIFRKENKVLVVDNDPQFNATAALMKPHEKPPRIRGERTNKIKPEQFFVRSWYMMSNPETRLDLIPSRIELYDTLRNPSQKEYLLDNFLKRYAQDYDYILIDCPPTPSVLTMSAFAASDYVLIPVSPDYFSTIGLPQFLGTLEGFKEDLHDGHNIEPLGVIFTKVPRVQTPDTLRAMQQVEESLEKISDHIPVFASKLSYLKVFQKCIWQAVPVHRISGPGQRGKSLAMADLQAIVKEVKEQIELSENCGDGE